MNAVKNDGLSVLIKTKDNLSVWIDGYVDENNEISFDWNKFIFITNEDKLIKTFQDDADNFMQCCAIAEDYLAEKGLIDIKLN